MSDGSRHDKPRNRDVRERDAADSQRQHQAETVDALEQRVGAADVPDEGTSMTPDEDVTTEGAPDDEDGDSVNEPPE